VFLLIDRVDKAMMKINLRDKHRFLKALLQLVAEYNTFRIVVTRQFPIREMEIDKEVREGLMEIWVDMTKPSPMHSSQ
jgi:hypothetical protein